MFASLQVLRLRVLLVAGLIAATSVSVRQVANAQTTAANDLDLDGREPHGRGSNGVWGTLGKAGCRKHTWRARLSGELDR